MPIYKYMTFDNLERLLNGTLRFTQPGAFNDPFEMVPELHVPESFGSAKHIHPTFSVTAPRRTPVVHELEEDFESDQCSDRNSRSIRASLDQAIGILCLSQNPSSLLMWSYYADSYAGAVVEFDQSHEFFLGHLQVEYRTTRPKKDISYYISSDDPIPIAELCIKPKAWEHEQEVRVIRSLSDCKPTGRSDRYEYQIFVMDIPFECIKSVTMGERMTIVNQRSVWKLIKDTNIALYLDAVSNWGYKFRKEPVKLPGMNSPIVSPRTAHIFSQQDGSIGDISRWQLESNDLAEIVNDTL